jgi:hypothetical protein
MTNQEIKTVGQTIAQETQIGGNTAARVGGVVEGIGVALDNKDAANGYYQATISGGTITVNAPNYLLGSGGNLRIKMPSAGTTASTLTIGNANAVQLWYNGAAVSAQNTWEANEIISVFYDGTRFMASNSQGGGGKAEKILYNNSQSGLSAENVQGALDEITETTNIEEGGINLSTATTLADTVINFGVEPPRWRTQSGRASILVPIAKGKKYKVEVTSDSPSSSRICVLANSTHTIGSTPSFATGLDNYHPLVEIGQYVVFTSPNNGNYLYINNVTSQGTVTVNVYEMDSVGNVVAENRNNIVALSVFDKGSGDAYITNYLIWENGAISSSTGLNTNSSTRIRTIGMHYATDNITITPSEGYQLYVIYYDENGNIAESNGWLTSETAILAGQHYRLVFAKTDSSIISPYELKNHITVTNGYVSDRLLAYKEDMRELNSCGGNLFALPEVGTSTKITRTSDGYSVTLTTTAKITANTQLRFVYLKLIEGRRYKLSFEYNFGASTSLGIRDENNVMLQALTAKLKGQGQYEGEFTYTSNMLYLGSVAYTDTPANTTYVLSNVKIYELAGGNGSSYEIINMEELHEMYGHINSQNTWSNNNTSKFALIDVSNHRGGQAVISTSANSIVAFLRDDSYPYDTLAIYANGTSRQYVDNLSDKGMYIPDDARFLYVSVTSSSGGSIKPSSVILTGGYSRNEEKTEFEQITRKRAVQLANIRWTALSNIAGNYCTAGGKVGMLYSSCVEVDRYVMFDISVKTFMTAANNPYSLLYTENLKTNVSQYGFTYYNHMATVHAWMGTVCSRFVFQCLGYEDWDTIHLAWLCKQGILQRSKSQASQDVEIGDIIWVSGHVRIIYDVINKGRQDMQIIVSEAKQPLVVSTLYTPSTLDSYMSSQHGIFYKYAGERNMVYEPSEFVNNYGEPLPNDYVYNDDICTYAGDYAAFRVGYPVWLNYNLKNVGSWNKIQLYKENWSSANVMTLSLVGEYTIDTSIHKFQIPASDIAGYGKYRARMSDGNTNSAYTFFEVIDTTVNCLTPDENNTNAKKVTFSSANAGYVKVVFCDRSGTPMAIRPLTLQEKINREIIINPVETCLAQRGETLDTNNTYLKVYFKGDYGRVTNEYLKVEF